MPRHQKHHCPVPGRDLLTVSPPADSRSCFLIMSLAYVEAEREESTCSLQEILSAIAVIVMKTGFRGCNHRDYLICNPVACVFYFDGRFPRCSAIYQRQSCAYHFGINRCRIVLKPGQWSRTFFWHTENRCYYCNNRMRERTSTCRPCINHSRSACLGRSVR